MKYGIREIGDVVLTAKTPMKIGRKVFYKDEPVIYFDTLKTSSLEGASTTVYAQGGRGNARLVSWDGEKTLTFTMEDALISPEGLMILSGAGLIEADAKNTIKQHVTETTDDFEIGAGGEVLVYLENKPYMGIYTATTTNGTTTNAYLKNEHYIYIMAMENGEVVSEPFLPEIADPVAVYWDAASNGGKGGYVVLASGDTVHKAEKYRVSIPVSHEFVANDQKESYVTMGVGAAPTPGYNASGDAEIDAAYKISTMFKPGVTSLMCDYYIERSANTKQIEITAESFGSNFYLEASTLFRNQDGADLPAEFIIPNCKVQSNFTFSMSSSGDPSTFTFTLDAFPGYTRFDNTKKVLCAIQVIEDVMDASLVRTQTYHDVADNASFIG